MRIVAGSARGRRLAVPAGTTTRPTSDRTREAVFGRLDAWGAVSEAHVLDLYCGSGALGLEALSRGAASAVGVEADRAAARVAGDNARTLDLPLQVVHDRVQRWLDARRGRDDGLPGFDLVLLDPPYDVPEGTLGAVLAGVADRCAPDAVVVVERSGRSPEPTWPEPLSPLEPRTYGETRVWFAERVA
ncbi:16S rRNA (guanine(966)-N(2))-methyltransferase RsmD [Jannaschia sp. R86511]|uniref:16S rRNA (guanine(966)-N(2))-methyltransferase RsmD n=1 Tax=Jannaschia sp. R86511 TaxID=3093853 RepID=UPI0036D2ACCA